MFHSKINKQKELKPEPAIGAEKPIKKKSIKINPDMIFEKKKKKTNKKY
jgi:hypothetical protein